MVTAVATAVATARARAALALEVQAVEAVEEPWALSSSMSTLSAATGGDDDGGLMLLPAPLPAWKPGMVVVVVVLDAARLFEYLFIRGVGVGLQ